MTEIKAFHDLVQSKQLSTGQIALWYALMYQNNKCAWTEWFTVPNITLELNCGLSKSGIHKARNVLKQYGVLDFKPNGTKATAYKIISQDKSGRDSNLDSEESGRVSGRDSLLVGSRDGGRVGVPLNKLNDTKLIDDDNAREEANIVFKTWEQNIGMLSPITIQKLTAWQNDMPDDVICKAIEIAVLNNARNFGYINTILNNWHKKNLKSLDAIDQEERNRQQKNFKQSNPRTNKGAKITPFNSIQGRDWDFEEMAKKERERQERLLKAD